MTDKPNFLKLTPSCIRAWVPIIILVSPFLIFSNLSNLFFPLSFPVSISIYIGSLLINLAIFSKCWYAKILVGAISVT